MDSTSGNRRILVIDDNPSIHEDFRKSLTILSAAKSALSQAEEEIFGTSQNSQRAQLQMELSFAQQGAEGLAKLKQACASGKPFAMAFVDMRMPPGWNGLRTIRELWSIQDDLEVVICTAYSDFSWEQIISELGTTDRLLLLKKPFDTNEIRQLGLTQTTKWNLRKAAEAREAELQRTAKDASLQLTTLVNDVQAGILLIDRITHTIIDANPAALAMIGRPRSEVVGSICHAHICPAQLGQCPIADMGQRVNNSERVLLTADGRRLDILKTVSPVSVRGREYLLETFVDISRQKEAELALRRSEARLSQAIGAAGLGIFEHEHLCDTIECSPLMREIFQWANDEPVTLLMMLECIVPDDREAFAEAMREAHEPTSNGLMLVDFRIHRRDGQERWVSVQARVFFEDSAGARHPTRTVGAIIDITQRKAAEAALRSSEEAQRKAMQAAEQASEHKSHFLASMSHELRTPMTAIIGYSDLMVRQQDRAADRMMWARQIQRNADYLLTLLNDILDLSKIEAGQLQVEPQDASTTHVLTSVVSLLDPIAGEKGIALGVVFSSPVPATIRIDPVRLRQILINLASNALKFTQRGSVTIRVSFSEGNIHFAVEDTGIGIPADKLPLLFKAFSQVHRSSEVNARGTGLGLAISRELASLLGGHITVDSVAGKGSCFTFHLPFLQTAGTSMIPAGSLARETNAPHAGHSPAPLLEGRHVLVVDDNPDNRRIIGVLLEETRANIAYAEDGRQALDYVASAQTPVDLIVLDMQMPVMDGYACARELRASQFKAPIIALTAHSMADDQAQCLQAGCDVYLSKPIVTEEFYAVLGKQLRASKQAAPAPPPAFVHQNPAMLELAREYAQSLPLRAQEIEQAMAGGDYVRLRTLIHRLKGTGANLGFPEITRQAAACEAMIKSGQGPQCGKAVAEFANLLKQVSAQDALAGS